MTDYLVEIGRNPQARKVLSSLGLPVKLPPALQRSAGPDDGVSLSGLRVNCAGAAGATLTELAIGIAEAAGADVAVGDGPHGLVFDASSVRTPSELRAVYDFLHPRVRKIARNGRIVLLGADPAGVPEPSAAACAQALVGFTRSLAKELGGKGTTVNLLQVNEKAADRLAGPLRFLLSRRSTFVSGQALRIHETASPAPDEVAAQGLAGKTAIVTGAARGIGAQIAHRLAEEGASVICVDLPSAQSELGAVANDIGGVSLALDLGAPDTPQRVCDFVRAETSGLDILVHNAGVTRDRTLGKMSEKWWDLCLGVNLDAPLIVNHALLDAGLLNDHARVVHLASIAGIGGNPGQTNYAAAKAGLIGYVAAMAPKYAARGVTFNAIAPGFIETRMTAAIPVVTRELARRLNSLGQGGDPRDVADVVAFVASPAACGLNGQTLRVCGQHLAGA